MRIGHALVLVAIALLVAGLTPADAAGPTWEQWRHVPGLFDVSGPRSDGRLVLATSGRLLLLGPTGAAEPFANGPGGYADDAGTEAYIAVSPGLHPSGARCEFALDDVYVLRLHAPVGVTRVSAAGASTPFATVAGVETLTGIAFDTTGRFGSRLLVSGPAHGRTAIVAIDCTGATQVITDNAPALEGGLAVAPAGFGSFGGALIAPDELSGKIYAIGPDGTTRTIGDSGLPTGGDIGVEGAGFVPAGFSHGGGAYYADRATPGNPHAGTDSLLRLDTTVLTPLGVRDGDLLVATEGGASMVDVRCDQSCRVSPVVTAPSVAHGEGHVIVIASQAAVARPPAEADGFRLRGQTLLVGLIALALLALVVTGVVVAVRRR